MARRLLMNAEAPSAKFFRPDDGEIAKLCRAYLALAEENERMRKALEPFARFGRSISGGYDWDIFLGGPADGFNEDTRVMRSHFKIARAALRPESGA